MSDFQYVNNISNSGEATILLYDTIGSSVDENGNIVSGIDGSLFAAEVQALQNVATKINVRINSIGGSVMEGYSIVSAILNSTIPVDTYIDGLAASIAGVIAMCGRNKYMMDYGTLMLHNPSGSNDKALLDLVKNTLVTVLSNNTPCTPDQISEIMNQETYFTSNEAAKTGLVNQIINSNKKVKIDMSSLSNMAFIYNKLINQPQMKLIKNTLGLEATVEENEIVTSIENLQKENKTLAETLATEKLAKEVLQKKLDAIEAEKEEAKKAEIAEMVNSFVESGKLKEDEKEAMIKLASIDFETVKNTLSKIGTPALPHVNILDAVKITNNATGKQNWTIRDFEKKDPTALSKIKNETPELYDRMFNDYYIKGIGK